MFRTLSIIVSGNAGSALLSLLRNLIVAWLLPVEDYGIAATFAIAISVIEMLSQLGMQQQIVQARGGDDPRFQAGLQGFTVMRGLISGTILFFSAGWIAAFLGIPEVAWAYQILAIVPVLSGLQHFDYHRLTRKMKFLPTVLVQTVPVALSLMAVWPAYLIFPDYRVMLVAICLQIALNTLMTHIVAERRYRLNLDPKIIGGALRFGWPLLLNNMLLFFVFNGEKIVVGRELGMLDLGILAMGITLTLTPTLVLAKTIQGFFLPQASSLQDDDAGFQTIAMVIIETVIALTAFFLLVFVLIGEPLVGVILGEKYAALGPLILWLALQQAVRVLKTGASIIALARAHTANALMANLVRLLALPVAWWAATNGAGLGMIITIATIGEALGLLISVVLLRRRIGLALAPLWQPALCMALLIGFSATVALLHGSAQFTGLPEIALSLGVLCSFGLILMNTPHMWAYIRQRAMVPAKIPDQ